MRGKFPQTYEDPDMRAWKEKVQELVLIEFKDFVSNDLSLLPETASKFPIFDEGVALELTIGFYITPPKYIIEKNPSQIEKELLPTVKKPDIDNYIKAVMDAMNELLYHDDGQIWHVDGKKYYSLNPRIEVEIR